MDWLRAEVLAVSDPLSPRYGQHLRRSEIAELTGVEGDARAAVRAWIAEAGHEVVESRVGDRLEFASTVAQVEALFSTRVHRFSRESDSVLMAADLFGPEAVAQSIGAVFGLHGTPLRRPAAPRATAGQANVTPALLVQQYGVHGAPPVSRGSKNRRATVEFQQQYTKQADLSAFFKQYVPSAQPGDDVYTCFPAGQCEPPGQAQAGIEAMLDIEYIMGPVPGIKTEVWTYNGMEFCTDLKKWTSDILDHEDPPQVFSISYGLQANISLARSQGCNEEIVESIEDDFAKIAARGVSLIFASGDSGSGGNILFREKLYPSWPASASHVTAVGATNFVAGASGEERATSSFGSGGGFSWRIPLQPWQQQAASAYLKRTDAGLPEAQDFTRAGRATPDVAALGMGYQVLAGGSVQSVGGTSASAPLFASLVSLLNEARLQKGKSALGFLNPLIYELGQKGLGFTDITVGNNRVGRLGLPFREGYSCTAGWDAVTGWGTPKFQDLLRYVEGLPSGRTQQEIVV